MASLKTSSELGFIPFKSKMATREEIITLFDKLKDEIEEKFEKIDPITDPEPNTVYGILTRQDKLVDNMNQLAMTNSNT